MIHSYTREAGVRNLEREIATLMRKQARRLAEGKTEKLVVTPEVVREALGVPKFRAESEVEERSRSPACRSDWSGRRWAATSCSSRRRACAAASSSR